MPFYFFNFADSRQVPLYEGHVTSHRLVTNKDMGSTRLGLHISEGKPTAAGKNTLYPQHDHILFVLEGSIGVGVEGSPLRFLKPGEGIFMTAGTPYDWAAGPDGWKIIIAYSPPME